MSQPEGQKRIVSDASDITGVVNPEARGRLLGDGDQDRLHAQEARFNVDSLYDRSLYNHSGES